MLSVRNKFFFAFWPGFDCKRKLGAEYPDDLLDQNCPHKSQVSLLQLLFFITRRLFPESGPGIVPGAGDIFQEKLPLRVLALRQADRFSYGVKYLRAYIIIGTVLPYPLFLEPESGLVYIIQIKGFKVVKFVHFGQNFFEFRSLFAFLENGQFAGDTYPYPAVEKGA